MKLVLKAIYGLSIILLFNANSCASQATSEQEDKTETSTITSSTDNQDQTTQTAPVDIPIYGAFDDLEPLFHRETDTTYVINFWATWCKPCVEELPYFEDLHDQFKGEKLKVILVSLDFPRDFEKKLIPFVQEHQLKSDVVLLTDGDYNAWIDKVNPEWGGAIPVTLVYNAKKRKFKGEQFANYDELADMVRSLL